MTYYVGSSSTTYPYRAVVYVEATFSNGATYTGSGVMVGPNDVLTASHVVHSGIYELATSITVYAARDGSTAPYGGTSGSRVGYFHVDEDGDGLLTRSESQYDVAVIGLGTRLGDQTGWFGLNPNGGSGYYNLTGYPAVYADASGPRMTNDYGYVVSNSSASVFDYVTVDSNPGNSGGPLWSYIGGSPYVAGIASTSGWAANLSHEYSTILGWISGNDDLIGAAVSGTAAADLLIGTAGSDVIYGLGGYDTISGGGGTDILYGNVGEDLLRGGAGADTLYGGQNTTPQDAAGAYRGGTDTLSGGSGGDVVYGNYGNDSLLGEADADTLYGGQDDDTVIGGDGGDVLFGNRGNDLIYGDNLASSTGAGSDTMYGGDGDDTAVFLFARASYAVAALPDGGYSLNASDRLYGIEFVRFSDGVYAVDSLI